MVAGYGDVRGIFEAVIQPNGDGDRYYVVRIEPPLKLQERGAATASGLTLRHYSHGVLHSRSRGRDIGGETSESVHVLLVPTGTALPESTAEIAALDIRAWASCVVALTART
jgi:hypothetical protein